MFLRLLAVEDKEEMRKDRAVKVSKRELNCLMAELFEITDNMSSDDEEHTTQTPESIAELVRKHIFFIVN